MPWATSLALLLGPALIQGLGWAPWWWLAATCTGAMACWVAGVVPPDPPRGIGLQGRDLIARLHRTWTDPGPWLVAGAFAVYSGQWLAVIGIHPGKKR